jgi:hypothetical protein
MIGVGGQYGWSESHNIDDVTLGGVVASSPDETVTVDFSVNNGTATWRESGFLHGFSTTEPLDDLITPLKVTTIRCHPGNWIGLDGAFAIYDRARSLGINKIQCVISDNYPYGSWPGDNGDWTTWENTIRDVVTRARNEGKVFYWDIWNEPNGTGQVIFGKQDPAVGWQQFLETWKRAVQTIRSINPSEIIVGPSLAGLAPSYQYMGSFLTYARDNNVLPDIISWHDHYDIATHVNWVRQTMVLMGISARPISINEYTDQLTFTNPGYLVKTIAQLEDADVDSASHTHWGDFYSTDLWVTDHSMDAILKPGTFEKRPPWWVYKGYADITGSFASVSGTMLGDYNVPIVYGLAGYDETDNTARVLLGKNEGCDASGTTVLLTHLSSLSNLAASGRVRITAERIPYKGWEPLAAPEDILDSIYTITDDQVKVVIPNLQNRDACTLNVTLSSLAFSDGFESGLSSGWQNNGCSATTSQKFSGSGSVLLNNSDSLTKSFSTVNLKNIQIRYARLTQNFISWNNTFVAEWSSDGGTTWTMLESLSSNSGWTLRAYDLPASAENNANFKIRFRVTQGILPLGESHVDDVRIVGDPVSGEVAAQIAGDANEDGAVDVSDLSILAANYGTTSGATWGLGDFTGDGAVDVSDLSLLAANYGTGSSDTLTWADAYTQAFGTIGNDTENSSAEADDASNENDEESSANTTCSMGLSLIVGLTLMGWTLVKLKE